ncbi:MAG: hypothetical protein ABIT64_06455 [Lysobacteraceae bacterium]
MTSKISLCIGRRKPANDSKAIRETRYLLSIPGMRESIRAGIKTSASKLAKKLR